MSGAGQVSAQRSAQQACRTTDRYAHTVDLATWIMIQYCPCQMAVWNAFHTQKAMANPKTP